MIVFNYSTIIDPILKDIRTYALEFSGIKSGDKILDVCCGTGDQAFYYTRKGAIAYGIDLNPAMVEVAKKKKKKLALENVFFQVADAQCLPFKDNFFDYASISFALHEKERGVRDKIISEMKRVVKKEGSLIFIDFKVPLPKNPYAWLIKSVEYFAGREHFDFFKDYLWQGGLGEILKKNRVQIEKRDCTKNGIIKMIKAKNI